MYIFVYDYIVFSYIKKHLSFFIYYLAPNFRLYFPNKAYVKIQLQAVCAWISTNNKREIDKYLKWGKTRRRESVITLIIRLTNLTLFFSNLT